MPQSASIKVLLIMFRKMKFTKWYLKYIKFWKTVDLTDDNSDGKAIAQI